MPKEIRPVSMEPVVRTPELQAKLEMAGVLNAMALLVSLWGIATDQEQWLAVSNALWQAARVSEELQLLEAVAMLEDMAKLAEIRAKMEAT